GARCGNGLNEKELAQVDHFAKCIGLAFQVVDDVLDAEAPTATLGKTAGKDAQQNKPTYVSVLGVSRSREFAEELRLDAHKVLAGFDGRAQRLKELADFIVLRKF
ncbi:MAG: polyprenyl synthetase family protein, partial [Burkholderiales bacterium]|nr:polyprenyl synthetase family protein [Burkholderiales bacterium]